jgi:hypothetical protein
VNETKEDTMTDYKDDALAHLNIAYQNEPDPHEVVCANAAAQVFATLYLAEQQRVANLIAVMDFYGPHRVLASPQGEDDVAEELRTLLGLT